MSNRWTLYRRLVREVYARREPPKAKELKQEIHRLQRIVAAYENNAWLRTLEAENRILRERAERHGGVPRRLRLRRRRRDVIRDA